MEKIREAIIMYLGRVVYTFECDLQKIHSSASYFVRDTVSLREISSSEFAGVSSSESC